MVCYKRPKNLSEFIVRAKLSKEISIRRSTHPKLGFKHCNHNCVMCNYSPKLLIVSSKTNINVPFLSDLNCLSRNILYYISSTKSERPCSTIKPEYIGQTGRSVCERFQEHKYSVNCRQLFFTIIIK